MAIDMTNVTYLVRYFINGNVYCDKDRHYFEYGKHQPIVPRVGDRVALDYVPELACENDEYADMPEHWYEVLGITYNMNTVDIDGFVMIDIEAVDVTGEVMDEAEEMDDCCPCMSCDCKGDC